MLTREENETLTRVGPGTPMGDLLRRFWVPALLEAELPAPDCAPVRLRLFGEDLVAFRDTAGRIGILDAYCAHRRAHLYFGRNEDGGIRCVYHGWKYDVTGACLETPSEPRDRGLKDTVRLRSYPALLRGGVIWTYMGPPALQPQPPQFEWSRLSARRRTATKRLQQCNWAQAVEGGIDSSHISFLHSATDTQLQTGAKAAPNRFIVADRHPEFEVKEARHGLLIAARRNAGSDQYYWRITQFLLPFYTMLPPVVPEDDTRNAPYEGHAWVPIDDENTWTWSFGANPHRDYTDDQLALYGGPNGFWGPIDAEYRPIRNRDNEYQLDRALQRNGNFTGILGIPNQDAAVQESMGPIVDRTKERLGQSDLGVASFRRLILRLAKELQQGREPAAARDGALYNVRSAALLLKRDEPFDQGSAWLTAGAPLDAAAE
jgi:phenylpropionate dioxygenase-like ring-hydroxylating dioxygenase large terminal subunit